MPFYSGDRLAVMPSAGRFYERPLYVLFYGRSCTPQLTCMCPTVTANCRTDLLRRFGLFEPGIEGHGSSNCHGIVEL